MASRRDADRIKAALKRKIKNSGPDGIIFYDKEEGKSITTANALKLIENKDPIAEDIVESTVMAALSLLEYSAGRTKDGEIYRESVEEEEVEEEEEDDIEISNELTAGQKEDMIRSVMETIENIVTTGEGTPFFRHVVEMYVYDLTQEDYTNWFDAMAKADEADVWGKKEKRLLN